LYNNIRAVYNAGQSTYIHCNGGHGRAGTVGAYVLGKLRNLDAYEAIQEIEKWRLTRPDQSKSYVPTPETTKQVSFLVKHLGLKEGHIAPDRSSRSWLKTVKKERKSKTTASTNVSDDGPVLFYERGAYFEFSNYYKLSKPFTYKGKLYATSEHAYQAAKFDYDGASAESLEYATHIANASTPNISRVLASQKLGGGYAWRTKCNEIIKQYVAVPLRPGWDSIKVPIMRDILIAKFTSDTHCKQVMLSTGTRQLVEHSPRDSFWGNGHADGLNMLGKLLMEVRAELSV
jgi:hypothetical protein